MRVYNRVQSGELQGATSATQGPDVDGQLVQFCAAPDNTGYVWIGGAGVTAGNGVTDTTSGIPLGPGDFSPLYNVGNVNMFYYICDNTTDDLFYVMLG